MVKIAVAGAKGHMGKMIIDAVWNMEGAELVAALAHKGTDKWEADEDAGASLGYNTGVKITDDYSVLRTSGAQVLIDFTRPEGTKEFLKICSDAGIGMVIGTTGLDAEGKAAIEEAVKALADTVNQNPVLKKAGVVDAGGKGYLIILEGMLRALRGEPVPEVADTAEEKADFAAIGDEDITFAFDTVFIVRKTSDKPLDGLRAYLNSIGDSLVIGEDDEAFKVHVHTDTPGDALNEAQKYGTLELAKIENMRTQAADLAAGKKAQSTDDLDAIEEELEKGEAAVAAPEKRYGFLAVCAGEGLAAVFRDLTVDRIVSGGQTMNPSTEAILQEVNRTPSEIVFILPNNKNIIMAAQQCVGLTEKQVIVVPTATVPQGISAMMAVDPDNDDPQAILAAMTEAAANVTTAQITYAARNSDFDGFAINEGDYLALCDGKLMGTDRNLDVLLERLARMASDKGAEFITVYAGEGVSDEDAARAAALFETVCPQAEVSALPGGQPVYYYIVAIE